MPIVSTLGAASSRGFGEFNQQAQGNYIENYFAINLYNGNGTSQNINAGVPLSDTGAWACYVYSNSNIATYSTKTDSSGNFYSVGSYGNYGFVTKQNSSGTILWQRQQIDTSSSQLNDVAVASSGNVYVAGRASGGSTYAVIAKYDSSGAIQWKRSLSSASTTYCNAIYVDSSENVYVTGANTAPLGFIAKYNSSGTLQWQRSFTILSSYGYGITADTSGNVYVAMQVINNTPQAIACLIKYDSSGTLLWQRSLSQSNPGSGYNVALDSSGNPYIVGSINDGTRQVGFIAKYNSSGTIQWQRKFYNGDTYAYGIAIDSSDNIYINAYGGASPLFGSVLKYNSSGSLQWQRKYSSSQEIIAYRLSVDTTGSIYAASYVNASTVNSYVLKLPTDGSALSGYAGLFLSSGTLTEAAGTATAATPTGTSAASTFTDANATSLTDSAGTVTVSLQTQAAVSGAGGLVWIKGRSGATDHALYDTARGATFDIASNLTTGQTTQTTGLTAFSASGFAVGSLAKLNTSSAIYAAWTFREQSKFFDIVTYTGNGANRTISHNLGSVPGMILIKRTDTTAAWAVYHRSLANTEYLVLNTTAAKAAGATYWNSTTPTSTVFSLGTSTDVNANGGTYVAYLFAHDAGGFGLTGSDNVISCGSSTMPGAGGSSTVTLGWEPQFIIMKDINHAGQPWFMFDTTRGYTTVGGVAKGFFCESANAEADYSVYGGITPTGFVIPSNFNFADNNTTLVYLAIRRGPMAVPTDATKVFMPTVYTGTNVNNRLVNTTIAPDMVWMRQRNSTTLTGMVVGDRLRGQPYLLTGQSSAEQNVATAFDQQIVSSTEYGTAFSSMNGVWVGTDAGTQLNVSTVANNQIAEAFKRAPSFFDEVCWTTTGNTNASITHNLTVPPEIIIAKRRNTAGSAWVVYANGATTLNQYLVLNTSAAIATISGIWGTSSPTSTTFNINETSAIGASGTTAVAYLFATSPGVSKIGTYTGTGTTNQINCGFTSGARFVLIKRTDSTGDWFVYDSARGIVAGNDPYILLNSTAAEVTSTDYVDAYSAGFELSSTAPAGLNANGGTFIFLAIA